MTQNPLTPEEISEIFKILNSEEKFEIVKNNYKNFKLINNAYNADTSILNTLKNSEKLNGVRIKGELKKNGLGTGIIKFGEGYNFGNYINISTKELLSSVLINIFGIKIEISPSKLENTFNVNDINIRFNTEIINKIFIGQNLTDKFQNFIARLIEFENITINMNINSNIEIMRGKLEAKKKAEEEEEEQKRIEAEKRIAEEKEEKRIAEAEQKKIAEAEAKRIEEAKAKEEARLAKAKEEEARLAKEAARRLAEEEAKAKEEARLAKAKEEEARLAKKATRRLAEEKERRLAEEEARRNKEFTIEAENVNMNYLKQVFGETLLSDILNDKDTLQDVILYKMKNRLKLAGISVIELLKTYGIKKIINKKGGLIKITADEYPKFANTLSQIEAQNTIFTTI